MRPCRPLLLALALGAVLAAPAHAQDAARPAFTLSGYGTFGVAHSDNADADYLVDAFKPNGPGHSRRTSADADSRLAVQGMVQFTPKLSAVVQLISEQRYDNSYRPEVEWANVKYQFTPELSVRAGRFVLPVFMSTDSRKLGYANPWVRPPVELYALVPVTHSDGVEGLWRSSLGDWRNSLQVTAGSSDSKFPDSAGFDAGTAKVRRILSVNNTIEAGFLTLRAIYGEARLTIAAFEPFAETFRTFGPPGAALAERYGLDDRKVKFVGVGASYDPGAWFLMAEAAQFKTKSLLGAKEAWYLSAGYRFGKFTPYATFARSRSASNTSDPGLPLAGLPPEALPTAIFLNTSLNQQLNLLPRQKTTSVGVRWDFLRNAALKVQYDQVDMDPGSSGTFGNVQPAFQPGGKVRILSATVDFVF